MTQAERTRLLDEMTNAAVDKIPADWWHDLEEPVQTRIICAIRDGVETAIEGVFNT